MFFNLRVEFIRNSLVIEYKSQKIFTNWQNNRNIEGEIMENSPEIRNKCHWKMYLPVGYKFQNVVSIGLNLIENCMLIEELFTNSPRFLINLILSVDFSNRCLICLWFSNLFWVKNDKFLQKSCSALVKCVKIKERFCGKFLI